MQQTEDSTSATAGSSGFTARAIEQNRHGAAAGLENPEEEKDVVCAGVPYLLCHESQQNCAGATRGQHTERCHQADSTCIYHIAIHAGILQHYTSCGYSSGGVPAVQHRSAAARTTTAGSNGHRSSTYDSGVQSGAAAKEGQVPLPSHRRKPLLAPLSGGLQMSKCMSLRIHVGPCIVGIRCPVRRPLPTIVSLRSAGACMQQQIVLGRDGLTRPITELLAQTM